MVDNCFWTAALFPLGDTGVSQALIIIIREVKRLVSVSSPAETPWPSTRLFFFPSTPRFSAKCCGSSIIRSLPHRHTVFIYLCCGQPHPPATRTHTHILHHYIPHLLPSHPPVHTRLSLPPPSSASHSVNTWRVHFVSLKPETVF